MGGWKYGSWEVWRLSGLATGNRLSTEVFGLPSCQVPYRKGPASGEAGQQVICHAKKGRRKKWSVRTQTMDGDRKSMKIKGPNS